jgi:hypothetical protein
VKTRAGTELLAAVEAVMSGKRFVPTRGCDVVDALPLRRGFATTGLRKMDRRTSEDMAKYVCNRCDDGKGLGGRGLEWFVLSRDKEGLLTLLING